ncbi:hypothetical protein [Nostoc sp.]|uniref:hypothetical protein n=1 Tax=Nostoc sp. TaxID=1180 RepID=UPI002FF7FE6A
MFIFTVTADTFLKVHPSELAELTEDDKLLIQFKSVLKVISYTEEGEYYRIILQDSMKGKDIWFIRKKYVQISALRSLSESPQNPPNGKTRGIAKMPECYTSETSDIKKSLELEGAQEISNLYLKEYLSVLLSKGRGSIEVEREVIKQLKAQLQKTPTIQERSSQPADTALPAIMRYSSSN